MNLYEKLNRLDDSLVESKRVVKKKKLTEKLHANEYKVVYHDNTAGRERRPETIQDIENDWHEVVFRADSDLDAWKEAFERVKDYSYDDYLDKDATEEDFVNYFEDSDWGDGSPILIKLSSSDSDLYDTGYTLESWTDEFVEKDYDDNIDEMLTESEEKHELSTLVKDSINHLVNDLGKDPMADDFGDDVCADLENNYDIHIPTDMVKYADWCDAVMSEVSRQLNNKEEAKTMLTL